MMEKVVHAEHYFKMGVRECGIIRLGSFKEPAG